MKEIIIDDSYCGKRLDRFLTGYFKNCSKNYIYKLIREKKIKVNKTKVDIKYILKKNDCIQIYISEKQYTQMLHGKTIFSSSIPSIIEKKEDSFQEISRLDNLNEEMYNEQLYIDNQYFLLVIYEDDSVIIIQKPIDMVVVEDEREKKWILTNFVRSYFRNNQKDTQFKISPVHRIDRNTTGLVIFAKKYLAFKDLTEVFKRRMIEKEYLAIVVGELLLPKTIVINLSKDEKKYMMIVDKNNSENDSKQAITIVNPLIVTKEATLVRVKIETGRTHQIRVTLASSGHPIINDIKYGQKKFFENFVDKYNIKTILLLAYSIKFSRQLPESISKLSGKRFNTILPDFWKDILNKHFNISEETLKTLIENSRKMS
ncbi:MAG: RluA family pseudouridine synthase [Exilispira sp.]